MPPRAMLTRQAVRLHQRQFGGADRVVRGGGVRHHQHQVVGGAQQLLLVHVARFALGFQLG
jgi:hypothetical protein